MHYIFRDADIKKFRYCPMCGEKMLGIYLDDYEGHTTCSSCNKDLNFIIIEGVLQRYQKWIEK